MMIKENITEVYQKNGYRFVKLKPDIFNLYSSQFIVNKKPTMTRKLRYLLMLPFGYYFIYMLDNNDRCVASLIISNGADFRYPFATKKDIIVGPGVVKREERGKGLWTIMFDVVFNHVICNQYDKAYGWLLKSNTPSLRTFERQGFTYFSDCEETKFKRVKAVAASDKYNKFIYVRNSKEHDIAK